MNALRTKVGDTAPWPFTMRDNGVPVDLTDAVEVRMNAHREDSNEAVIVNQLVAVEPDQVADKGGIVYEPVAADVAEDGVLLADFTVLWTDGTVSTFPTDEGEFVPIEILKKAGGQ